MLRLNIFLPMLASVLLGSLLVGCDSATPATSDVASATTAPSIVPTATPAAPASPTPDNRTRVAVSLSNIEERASVEAALRRLADVRPTDVGDGPHVQISDLPLAGGWAYPSATWVAITDQRRDVLALTANDVESILLGAVTDWAELGGSPTSIATLIPAEAAAQIGRAYRVDDDDDATLPQSELGAHVAATPGAFALVPAGALDVGVLAAVVDGHDPYRDPAADSPLLLERWVHADDEATAGRFAEAAGLRVPPSTFDPFGLLATGELIPARCTDEALQFVGDIGAMFDGTREALRAPNSP